MPPLNNTGQGVTRAMEARRSTANSTTPGQAVVVKVTADSGLEFDYTGADAGTGDVVIRLPLIDGITEGMTLYSVVLDKHGRVVGGSKAPIGGGGSGTDIGEDPVFSSVTATRGLFQQVRTQHLVSDYPIPVSSGGIGNTVADAKFFFAGPLSGDPDAPLWRRIQESDLPDQISFLRLHGLPSTLVGYGITDAYTRVELDAIIASVVHDSNLPAGGVVTQALMGDRNWHNLTTDIVPETTSHQYFHNDLARAAIASVSDNIDYNAVTGKIDMLAAPAFQQVHVAANPTQADHVINLDYIQTQYQPTGALRQEIVNVTEAIRMSKTVQLQYRPLTAQRVCVLWNGLDCAGYFDLVVVGSSASIALHADIELTAGDKLVVSYNS